MNDKIMDVLKDRPIVIPRLVFRNYKKLNITEEELIVLIFIINNGDKIVYNPDLFVKEIGMDKYRVMQVINDLSLKNLIEIKVEKNDFDKMEEYIYIEMFYVKLFNLLIEYEKKIDIDNTDLFSVFEQELGRTISPMEVEKIREWLSNDFSEELIKEALKEAVYKNARSINYINSILYSWKQKGIKTVREANLEKQKFRSNKSSEPVFDYNWLEDE